MNNNIRSVILLSIVQCKSGDCGKWGMRGGQGGGAGSTHCQLLVVHCLILFLLLLQQYCRSHLLYQGPQLVAHLLHSPMNCVGAETDR